MQTIGTQALRRGWRGAAAVLVAGTILAGSLAPASAAMLSGNGIERHETRAGFHHHFYRGVPGQNRGADTADVSAIDADMTAQEDAAMGYCAERYRSYDPASGTYLGYDGHEHACP